MENSELEFVRLGDEEKNILLDILGYYVDEATGVIYNKETNKEHICPLTNDVVFVENASILPGSTIVMNTNELSLSEYFSQYFEKMSN